jgi:hypothetical protein
MYPDRILYPYHLICPTGTQDGGLLKTKGKKMAKVRQLTYSEYLEIKSAHYKMQELYSLTKDSALGGICDAYADFLPELEERFDPPAENKSNEYDRHIRSVGAIWRFV